MKETPLSTCERTFILSAIKENLRLDGRQVYDYRQITITYGIDRGCCQVSLGNTRVLAQASCEVVAPKQTRPNEGMLYINLELSPMACPSFEVGRSSDYSVEINRALDRCLRDSRCLDLESLCISAGEKAFQIRLDIHVLNHEGNILDCCNIAGIAALVHFRRPDVTVSGEEITIHALDEHDPVPLNVYHMPLTITFAFYHNGNFLLVDPTEKEERVMEGKIVLGMNKHRELCMVHVGGSMLVLKEQVLRCASIAVTRVTEITELIQKALQNDADARARGEKFGFAQSFAATPSILQHSKEVTKISVNNVEEVAHEISESNRQTLNDDLEKAKHVPVNIKMSGTGQIGIGGPSTWEELEESDSDVEFLEIAPNKQKMQPPVKASQNKAEIVNLESDSEEEVIMLEEESKKEERASSPEMLDLSVALNPSISAKASGKS